MKKFVVMIIAAVFVFAVSGMSFAETITKIEGNKITVMDSAGKTKTVISDLKGLKVGDKVRVITEKGRTWLNPQPEPPMMKGKGLNQGPTTPEQPTPPPKTSPNLK